VGFLTAIKKCCNKIKGYPGAAFIGIHSFHSNYSTRLTLDEPLVLISLMTPDPLYFTSLAPLAVTTSSLFTVILTSLEPDNLSLQISEVSSKPLTSLAPERSISYISSPSAQF
jgi:hypothetical protein